MSGVEPALPSPVSRGAPARTPACRLACVHGAVALLVLALPLRSLGAQDADSVPRRRLRALPVIGYSEATGLQYGATAFRTFQYDRLTRPSSQAVYVARTANNHTKAFAQVDGWLKNNRRHIRVRVEYISYPLPYFGIGADTRDDTEEWYSSGVTTSHVFDQRAFGEGLYVLLGFRTTKRRMRETETDGPLQALVSAERSPLRTFHLQLGLVHDTRDDISAPRRGAYTRVITSAPLVPPFPGASQYVRFFRHTIDARGYLPLGTGPVIALQAQYDAAVGARVPFDHLAMIGADTAMRGYARGRFRDRQAIATQAEFRSGYWRRIGVVTFAGVGAVAPRIGDLATTRWHPAAGLGLRYRFAPPDRSTLRLDLAFGRRSVGLNMGINEAF